MTSNVKDKIVDCKVSIVLMKFDRFGDRLNFEFQMTGQQSNNKIFIGNETFYFLLLLYYT